MRTLIAATSLLASGLLLTTHAQLVIPYINTPAPAAQPNLRPINQQQLMDAAPGIQLPPSSGTDKSPHNSGDNDHKPTGGVRLSDVIGSQRSINIFAGFTRDIESISERLDDTAKNTTVLAPTNAAITALPRKPWEDPREYAALGANAYEGADGVDRAHNNLKHFTEAHVVPVSPWDEGVNTQTLAGSTIWWERRADGQIVVQPGNVEVRQVADRVGNGEVWVLERNLNYAQ